MGIFYQTEDAQLIDYQMTQLHDQWFRGPLDRGPDSIAWMGAAQTFGRYVCDAFPWIVGSRLHLGTLNLGSGGKGPEYYLRRPELLEEANNCRAAVIQLMGARTADNRLFRSLQGGDTGTRTDTGEQTKAMAIINELVGAGRSGEARALALESQRAYVESTRRLLDAMHVPTVLLWFGNRRPPTKLLGFRRLLAIPPQLTTREMVREIRPSADRYVEIVSQAGVPQPLHDFDGNPAGSNSYYPSPEMHQLAADRLTPVLRELVVT